ncbi:50S ribosomal protein L10 [Candidatus Daviesbacteria bacterium]|nr:50S ribosomal protein L10 [Candidatus Daviesbacteria bacterium]
MAKTRDQKQQSVTEYAQKLGKSKSVVFTDYKGLTMKQLSDLRNKLGEVQAELTVTKNTLLKLALEKTKSEGLVRDASASVASGPTATLFAYEDEITPIKLLVKALKDAQIGQVKGGFLDNQFLDSLAVNKLANLPGKLELQAKVVGLLNAPLSGMVGVLQANLRNLVFALDQIRAQKGGE